MVLSSDDIREVGECFTQAFNHTLANTFGQSKEVVMEFAYDVILRKHPWMMLTPAGVSELVDTVFTSEDIRDFVLTLSFNFFNYWGNDDTYHDALAGVLSRAAGHQTPSLIPKIITDRMATESVVEQALINNRWIMSILLLKVWIEAPDPDAQTPPKKG